VQRAVTDLDKPPSNFDSAPAYAPAAYTPPPSHPASAPPQETPRRRSTIREPAPISTAGAPPSPSPTLPPPAPVISSTASDEAGTPKRGWWGKRLIGDKD